MNTVALSPLALTPLLPTSLNEVLKHPGIWRRSAPASNHVRAQSTGIDGLDAMLPGRGWPNGALIEIQFDCDGVGELALVMPALAQLTQRQQRVVFVAPPHIPYAPALAAQGVDLRYAVQIDASAAQGAWSAEQCLRSGACGAVLSWLGDADYTQLRRLQLAAESGDALSFLFRPARFAAKSSPAALRLRLQVNTDPMNIGPIHTDPINADPISSGSIDSGLINAGRINSKLVHSKSINSNPINSSPVDSDPINFDSIRKSPLDSDSIRNDSIRNDPTEKDRIEMNRVKTDPFGNERIQDDRAGDDQVTIEILKCRGNLDRQRPTRLRYRA